MIYRKHVRHASRKNFQLDLFTPDDGHFEYYVRASAHRDQPDRSIMIARIGRW
jgi:hypothetical protein